MTWRIKGKIRVARRKKKEASSEIRRREYQALETEGEPSQYTEPLKENRRDLQSPRQN